MNLSSRYINTPINLSTKYAKTHLLLKNVSTTSKTFFGVTIKPNECVLVEESIARAFDSSLSQSYKWFEILPYHHTSATVVNTTTVQNEVEYNTDYSAGDIMF